jgi:hypothetical protein
MNEEGGGWLETHSLTNYCKKLLCRCVVMVEEPIPWLPKVRHFLSDAFFHPFYVYMFTIFCLYVYHSDSATCYPWAATIFHLVYY